MAWLALNFNSYPYNFSQIYSSEGVWDTVNDALQTLGGRMIIVFV